MRGLDDIVRRAFSARKDIEEKKRRRLCFVVRPGKGVLEGVVAAALVAGFFFLLLTCNIDSPYTDLLMEKVSDDSELEDESKDELEGARGILDESFGTGGVVTHHSAAGGGHNDNGDSVCVDGNGRILVAGYSWNGSDHDMAVWRYLEDGSLDASFGDDGVVTHHNAAGGGGGDYGHSVCVDRSGRILVAGGSSNVSNKDMALWRYLENGSLDTCFGT